MFAEISANAGRGVIFIASPTQTASLKLQAGPRFDYDVLASQALADATIVALEPSSLVSAWGGAPDFETSTMMLLHQESATPGDIVSSGGGAAVPVKSMWQSDSVALRGLTFTIAHSP